MHNEADVFEVQQDIDYVFLHALDGAVLMQHPVDLHFGNGAARHRREQNTAQSVAQRVAEAPLQRLKGYLGSKWGIALNINLLWC